MSQDFVDILRASGKLDERRYLRAQGLVDACGDPLHLALCRLGLVAGILAAEIESAMKRLVTLIEPSLIIVIGCFVAFVVISLLTAILEINALAI